MAKKPRRARRRRESRSAVKARSAPTEREEPEGPRVTTAQPSSTSGLAEQYAYVYGDLKRIAILAGAFFAILIVLSFVI
jgi:hypothetical protein